MITIGVLGALTRIRTWDLPLRRRMLYPLSYQGDLFIINRVGWYCIATMGQGVKLGVKFNPKPA